MEITMLGSWESGVIKWEERTSTVRKWPTNWKSVNSHHVSGWKKGRLARASNGPDAAFLQSMHVSSCIDFIQLPIQSIWLIVTLSKGINDVDYRYIYRDLDIDYRWYSFPMSVITRATPIATVVPRREFRARLVEQEKAEKKTDYPAEKDIVVAKITGIWHWYYMISWEFMEFFWFSHVLTQLADMCGVLGLLPRSQLWSHQGVTKAGSTAEDLVT